MEEVFRALADPSRRRLLDALNADNGQNLRQLSAGLDMTRQSVSKHLAVLEGANLVTTIRHGREKLHYLNAAPINDIAERWITQYDRHRVHALADLKRALEDTTMGKPEFVYTTYIDTTPEKLWQGLTDPAFTSRYWHLQFETDWQPGAAMVWDQSGVRVEHPEQVVLEYDPYRRLAYTWHSFTPELAQLHGFSDEFMARVTAEPRSRVAFDLEDAGGMVKLTVVHDGFEEGSTILQSISGGWPQVISSLKTLLETGDVLPIFSDEAKAGRRKAEG